MDVESSEIVLCGADALPISGWRKTLSVLSSGRLTGGTSSHRSLCKSVRMSWICRFEWKEGSVPFPRRTWSLYPPAFFNEEALQVVDEKFEREHVRDTQV